MQFKTSVKRLFILIVTIIIIVPTFILGPYALRVQHFTANPAKGYYADFYLYVSPQASRTGHAGSEVTILVQPNNSGINSDDVDVHRKDAWWTGFGRQKIADELGVILLVPAFIRPGEDWQIYTHALDRDTLTTSRTDLKRIDLQLLAMVDHARAKLAEEGIQTDDKFLIQGFSASGMFANRFTVLHPERVKAVAAGSPGGWPIAPVERFNGEELPYPAGIADLEALTGLPFNSAAYNAVPQLIVMGSIDDNDSLDYTDGWEETSAEVVVRLFGSDPLSRWDDAESLYRQAGANAQFVLVDGMGHDRKALQTYTMEFFKNILSP